MSIMLRACLLAAALYSTVALAQQTDNYALRAVPPPGPVVLDGKLGDWDLSGSILSCYDLETMRDRYAVRSAAMYDADYLYLSFRFRDATPLVNHVDPANKNGSGWRSDCVQLRLWTDHEQPFGPPAGGRMAHFDCYYFTDGARPSAHVAYNDMAKRPGSDEGSIAEAIGKGVDAAFAKDADGKGYTQELRIAWKLLRRNGQPYVAGQTLRMGMEFMWGDPTGERWPQHRFADLLNRERPQREFFWVTKEAWGEVQFLPKGNVEPSPSVAQLSALEQLIAERYRTAGPVALPYTMPTDGFATLVVEKPDGTRVRNLMGDYPRKAGANTDFWDGTDDQGRLVAPGEYRVRGLTRGAFDARMQFAYGSPGTPPWETGDGRGDWLSDHQPPVGVASDGQWTYLSTIMSEGGSTVIGLDEQGQKRWGIGRMAGGLIAMHGKYLYMMMGGNHPVLPGIAAGELHLLRLDPRQGKLANFADGKAEHPLAKYPDPRSELGPRHWRGEDHAALAFDAAWCRSECLGFAAAGDRLYASLFFENQVLVIDPDKGEVVGKLALPQPAGLAGGANGRLYAISGRQVGTLDPASGNFAPIVTAGLEAPLALTVDGTGNLYVADWGKSQCIKVFDPQGRFLRTLGKPGGRPLTGAYDPRGLFRPRALAWDGQGRLWVTEYDYQPKRVSLWQPDGTFVREICGPTWYGATECNVDELNPNQAFCMGNTVALDWRTGQWRVTATLWRPLAPNALFGPVGEGLVLETRQLGRRRLLIASRTGSYLCISELQPDGSARPLMACGSLRGAFFGNGEGLPEMLAPRLWDDPAQLAWARKKFPAVFAGGEEHVHRDFHQLSGESKRLGKPVRSQFWWTDANGDGLVQNPELKVFRPDEANGLLLTAGWRSAVGPDWTLFPAGSDPDSRHTRAWRLPLQAWNSCGAPVYDLAQATPIYDAKPDWELNSVWADRQGGVLLNQSPLTLVEGNGQVRWTYPNRWPGVHGSHSAPKDRQGLLIGPLKVIGSVEQPGLGEVFCLSGNMGKAFLMTADGLYVGGLFRDCRAAPEALPDQPQRGLSIAESSPGGEWFGGEFFRNCLDGKPYIGSACRNASLLSELTGLESVRRLETQTVTFTPAQYRQAEALLAAHSGADAVQESLELLPPARRPSQPPVVEDFVWNGRTTASWSYDERRFAEATWTCDEKMLYVCFRNVGDPNPMINRGTLVKQLFKTGDAALLELRPTADARDGKLLPGDFRLLFSVFEDKPVAVLYRFLVPGTPADRRETFSSPVIATPVDEVRVLATAKIAIDRGTAGYTLRAAVPLADLGFAPKPGASYRGDFGIVYSDTLGKSNELRMNWHNRATGLVSDLPHEAMIVPANWGTFVWQDRK